MTREEEIRQASIAYTQSHNPVAMGGDYMQGFIDELSVNPAFIAGAEWADNHSNSWISVKDKLPEVDKVNASVPVIAVTNKNYWFKAVYDYDLKEWFFFENDFLWLEDGEVVTHWMYCSQLPTKG